jgi:hypothetical protein
MQRSGDEMPSSDACLTRAFTLQTTSHSGDCQTLVQSVHTSLRVLVILRCAQVDVYVIFFQKKLHTYITQVHLDLLNFCWKKIMMLLLNRITPKL